MNVVETSEALDAIETKMFMAAAEYRTILVSMLPIGIPQDFIDSMPQESPYHPEAAAVAAAMRQLVKAVADLPKQATQNDPPPWDRNWKAGKYGPRMFMTTTREVVVPGGMYTVMIDSDDETERKDDD